MKPFATVLARVRPGVRMNQEMCGQSTGTFESFATLFAFKDLLHAVNGPAKRGDYKILLLFYILRRTNRMTDTNIESCKKTN